MIKYILFFVLLASPVLAKPKPTPRPTPRPSATPEYVCRTKQKDLELRDWIDGVLNELHKAQADLIAAQKSNGDVQSKLAESQRNATELANQCKADHDCAAHPISCGVHRLMKHVFWIAIALIGVLIALCVASFFFPALGPIMGFLLSIWNKILSLFKPKPPV